MSWEIGTGWQNHHDISTHVHTDIYSWNSYSKCLHREKAAVFNVVDITGSLCSSFANQS